MGGKLGIVSQNFISSRDKLTQVKFLHRVYYPAKRLQRMFPQPDPNFPRCDLHMDTYMHMFWECPVLVSFWREVFAKINFRLQINLTRLWLY